MYQAQGSQNWHIRIIQVLLLLTFLVPGIASESPSKDNKQDTAATEDTTHTDNGKQHSSSDAHHGYDLSLKKAERLFYGLYIDKKDPISCAGCHNTRAVDTFNWNPSALDIAELYQDKTVEDLNNAIHNPTGMVLSEKHAGYDFSEEEVQLLKLFLDNFAAEHETLPEKPNINKLLIFIGLTLLLLLAIIDLLFTKVVKFKAVHLLIILFSLVYNTRTVVEEAIDLGRQEGYQPAQPIKFSHEIHVKQNKIDCRYCHTTVEYSKSASIPPASTCLNCHSLIREGSNSGAFEINKIHAAIESGDPIEWIKVHNLPDHVYFNHAQHVGAGGLDCAECHGVVEDMHELKQVSDLSMGWCLDCHRTNEVDFTNNAYYQEFEELHEDLKAGKIEKVTPEMVGATDCMKCHY